MHNFSQSSPNTYFTPKKRSQTAEKFYSDKAEKSTAQKYYDLEDSFKHYEQLLEQNLYLKNLLLKQNIVEKVSQKVEVRNTLKRSQMSKDEQLSQKYGKNSSTKCYSTNEDNMYQQMNVCDNSQQQSQQKDIIMWSIKNRNNYLEQKINGLQKQYVKQTKTIDNIKNSEKWRNRLDCKETTCYQDKYLKLLRVKSPVLLQ